ncbi:permease [Corynebacterium canis]|uniref:Permease n=1 Tax=Corynebacterium canis TaxID=679663 RepID=A0A5C5UMJ3_9CORY|nr:permease [Corynebacterium canis]TWT26600.1 permease [Corynebacterium canis]WJY76382.1 putative permease [Corynebacterium canis]
MTSRIDVPTAAWALPLFTAVALTGAFVVIVAEGRPVTLPGTLDTWATVFLAIMVQAIPFLVLGTMLSGAISAWVPASVFRKLPANMPVAALSGMVLPACECASVPVAHSLMRRGVSQAQALVFLVASPAVNPVVIVATAVAFPDNPRMVWARFVASLAAAMFIGWIWKRIGHAIEMPDTHSHHHGFIDVAARDFLQAAGFLVPGAMAAAAFKLWVPNSFGSNVVVAVLFLVAAAIILSLCSEADAFVAASFTTAPAVAQLAFMVVGPMIDVKLIMLHAGTFGPRFALRFLPLVLACAVIASVAIGLAFFGLG